MVIYKCNRCCKEFTKKWDFQCHEMRKFKCVPVNPKNSMRKVNTLNNIKKLNSMENPKTEIVMNQCNYCYKKFASKSNTNKHIKFNCKIKKKEEANKETIFNELLNKLNEIQKETNDLKNELKNDIQNIKVSNNYSIKNIQNIQNNNFTIKLVAYGKEDIEILTNSDWNKILLKNYKSIEELTKIIHFDKNKPENHNIYIPNIKSKFIMVYDGEDWKLQNKKDVLEDLYDTKAYIIFDKVDKIKNGLAFHVVDKFNKIKNDYDNTKIKAVLLQDIELLLYNKKVIPIMTKKKIEDNLIE